MVPLFAATLIGHAPEVSIAELPYALGNLLIFSGYVFFVAFIAFSLGVLIVGLPTRWALERLALNGGAAAAVGGGVWAGSVALLLFGRSGSSIVWVAMMIIAGGVAGFFYFRTSTT